MKKFSIATAAGVRVVNANEYSVAPKTNTFSALVMGVESFAASTAGKGKSAIPNFYLYFREGNALYYFRSTPDEIAAARATGLVVDAEGEADRLALGDAKTDDAPVAPEAEAPTKPKRSRAKARA